MTKSKLLRITQQKKKEKKLLYQRKLLAQQKLRQRAKMKFPLIIDEKRPKLEFEESTDLYNIYGRKCSKYLDQPVVCTGSIFIPSCEECIVTKLKKLDIQVKHLGE